jgi:hypothetical protein
VVFDVVCRGYRLAGWLAAPGAAARGARPPAAALRAADRADRDAETAQEIAATAEEAAASAERAAKVAREASRRANETALALRGEVSGADQTATNARGVEAAAKGAYHEAEGEARRKFGDDGG